MQAGKIKLGVILYPDVQPMDALGPWEVFATWQSLPETQIDLLLIAEKQGAVACANNITMNAHVDFTHCPPLDYLIIPGGRGRLAQATNKQLLQFIQQQATSCKKILSVCTGAFILYHAGVLKDESITTYWRAIPELKSLPGVHVLEQRVVKSGKIWASGGISSGIDLALDLIADIAGTETAAKVQLLFEYFPEGKIYTTQHTIHELPAYYTQCGEERLAEYIKEDLQKISTQD